MSRLDLLLKRVFFKPGYLNLEEKPKSIVVKSFALYLFAGVNQIKKSFALNLFAGVNQTKKSFAGDNQVKKQFVGVNQVKKSI